MTRRRIPSAAVVTFLSIVVGVVLGNGVATVQDRANERYQVYTAALAHVENDYVTPLDARCVAPLECGSEGAIYDSIDGMLRTLDPHSSFFPPREYAALRERQEGSYSGIGIQIVKRGDDVVVTSLFEGSPAYAAGLRRGDVIARVGDQSAKGWTTDDVVAHVKGKAGTTVNISLQRPDVDGLIVLDVARAAVRIPSVRAAFMLGSGTGYVRLQDFEETSDSELRDALDKLKAAGMQRLVLDLRDNPGGPLDQAIAVASEFLHRGLAVVRTRGRIADSDHDYNVTDQGAYTDVPIVVLVDRSSASASEIVTGSIQDHDRGYIVGETTFGKSLVQSVFPISNRAGLALTTGHYYTPSGRMIQRPWDQSFDEYETYTLRDQAGPQAHAAADLKHTDAGRDVYGSGGIEPDHFVPGAIEGFDPNHFVRAMRDDGEFVGFAERFVREGDTRPGSRSGPNAYHVSAGWPLTDAMMEAFHTYVASRMRMNEAAYNEDLPFIRAMIHFEVDTDLFGVEEARRNITKVDPQMQVALSSFDQASHLMQLPKSGKTPDTGN